MTITPHFCWIYHGKGDDVRLAYVRPSVARGMVIARIERRPDEQSRFGGRGPLLVLHKNEDRIVRAATNQDTDEVASLAKVLVECGISADVLREAVPS